MTYSYNGVEYIPDSCGTAEKVMCPLVDEWVDPIDCLENQSVIEDAIPSRFKEKENWVEICKKCPFRNY